MPATPRGQNTSVSGNAADNVFASPAGGLQYELLNLVANSGTGGYDGTLTVGINAPVAGLTTMQPETGGQFVLEQNTPNPFRRQTGISFSLVAASHVELAIYDMPGREIVRPLDEQRSAGEHTVTWDAGTGLASGNYLYEIAVTNRAGTYRQAKVMMVQ